MNITYIIPSYNQASFIAYTIRSVLQNMAAGDELLIADGASTDGTDQVVSQFLSDSRISWHSEPDRGYSDAVGKALRLARNPIVGIQSSDDAYRPGIREQVLESLRDDKIDLVYADYRHIDLKGNPIGERHHKSGSLSDILSLRILLPQSSVFFKKSALDGLQILNIAHDYVADIVLFNQICLRGGFRQVPAIWSEVRKHPGSRTGKRNPGTQYLHAMDTALAAMPDAMRSRARAGGLLLRARYEASSGDRGAALATLLAAAKLDLGLPGHWLFPRTLLYLGLGPEGVSRVSSVVRRSSPVAETQV